MSYTSQHNSKPGLHTMHVSVVHLLMSFVLSGGDMY